MGAVRPRAGAEGPTTSRDPLTTSSGHTLARISLDAYDLTVREKWAVILSVEVADWYRGLRPADRRMVDKMLDKLSALGNQLRMPHSRPLGNGLFELRFSIERATVAQRITYIFDPDQRVITLTTFRKTRSNEQGEIARARRAKDDYEKGINS